MKYPDDPGLTPDPTVVNSYLPRPQTDLRRILDGINNTDKAELYLGQAAQKPPAEDHLNRALYQALSPFKRGIQHLKKKTGEHSAN